MKDPALFKQQIIGIVAQALVALLMAFAAYEGLSVSAPKAPVAVVTPASGGIGVKDFISSGIKCSASADLCVQSNWGRDIGVFSDEGATATYYVSGTTGTIRHSGLDAFTPATRIIATTTFPLTPTGSFQIVSSNQNGVTSTIAGAGAGFLPGTRVTLINTGTNTVGFTAAAGSLSLGADRQLGISDTLTIIWTGSSWVETAYGNN